MENNFKIYTKTGDKGETSLIGGKRVPKYHSRIEAYGTLDELNSFIGHLRDQLTNEQLRDVLLEIQDRLFTAESILATEPGTETARKLPQLFEEDVLHLEREIDRMNESLQPLSSFLLPGGYPLVSLSHVCRTVCRRAERICIRLATETVVDDIVIRYLNRLSDYLFVLARYIAFINGVPDLPWKARV
ncbi:MAG TPA: cob(I)yrinic acid a,c-diamide adenosyltransferase [Bacteroidales bacterium]|nr:cob(I)yrinic acid a,c-diamide adenosyltransferase [Bacteroidales bacterium]